MKTNFTTGVVVTPAWLNGSKSIVFDGAPEDWHYPPLGLESLETSGPFGLDTRYVTLGSDQPNLAPNGAFISGNPVSGKKVVTGIWSFGFDPSVLGNPVNTLSFAPKSYTTLDKYLDANGIPTPSIPQKFAALDDSDLVTAKILSDQIDNLSSTLIVDNGEY